MRRATTHLQNLNFQSVFCQSVVSPGPQRTDSVQLSTFRKRASLRRGIPKTGRYKMESLDVDQHADLEEKVIGKAGRGVEGSRRGGRGDGRGRGGAGGRGEGRMVQISKALSRLLRHQAENAGIKLDEEGFAPLDQVISWGPLKSLKVTLEEIQSTVADNDKQRFLLKPNPKTNPSSSTSSTEPHHYLIRANQGHSLKVDSSAWLAPITLEDNNVPTQVLHGTYFAFWPEIVASGGLKPMGRNHVHCSTGRPEDGVKSGMRRDAELIIEIDVEASLREGVKWWKSDNDVILTEGGNDGFLSTKFFKLVTGRTVDIGVLWERGEKVGNLPPGLKIRVPNGKRRGGGGAGRGDGRSRRGN